MKISQEVSLIKYKQSLWEFYVSMTLRNVPFSSLVPIYSKVYKLMSLKCYKHHYKDVTVFGGYSFKIS